MKLKEPLHPKKWKALIRNKDDPATKNILVEHNLRLVMWTIKKYFADYRNTEFDDMFQCGVLGLLTAIDRYDSAKGAFANYAIYWIRNYIQRNVFMFTDDRSLDEPTGDDITLADIIPDPGRPFTEKVEDKILAAKIRDTLKGQLTDSEYKILDLHYGLAGKEPRTIAEVARQLNITRSTANDTKRRVFRKMRKYYIDKGLDSYINYYETAKYSHTKQKNKYNKHSIVEQKVFERKRLRKKFFREGD